MRCSGPPLAGCLEQYDRAGNRCIEGLNTAGHGNCYLRGCCACCCAGTAGFAAYHLDYNAAIPWVVIVPGFTSFLACIAFPWTRPADVPRAAAWVVAAGGLGSVLSTVLWAIPMHDRLDRIGQDAATIDSLVMANGLRTACLTAATAALGWSVVRLVRRG